MTTTPTVLFDGRASEPTTVSELIGQAIGAGSTCWDNLDGAGVFHSERASLIVDDVLAALTDLGIDASTPLQRGTIPL